MENRLTQTQLAAVVAEVERLSQQRDEELNPDQVKEILQELNLPTDLLEDALVQLRRREALERQHKRNRLITAGVVVVLIAAIAITTILNLRHQQQLAEISPIQSRIALDQDNGGNLSELYIESNLNVYYLVTLKNVPLNSRLSLTCDWIDPKGQVVHQSRYQTRQIDQPVWTTYCYHQLTPKVAKGTWEARMFLEGRSLNNQKFVVK